MKILCPSSQSKKTKPEVCKMMYSVWKIIYLNTLVVGFILIINHEREIIKIWFQILKIKFKEEGRVLRGGGLIVCSRLTGIHFNGTRKLLKTLLLQFLREFLKIQRNKHHTGLVIKNKIGSVSRNIYDIYMAVIILQFLMMKLILMS